MTRPILLSTLAVAAVLHGCACDTVPDAAVESCDQSAVFAGSVATDILFVIDDSGSMSQEQLRLRDALGRFIATLDASPISDDFQIGVTNTSVADADGDAFYTAGPSGDPRFVDYPAGTIVAVDTDVVLATVATWGDFLWDGTQGFYDTSAAPRILAANDPILVTAFQRNVLQGTYGSGREQPFAAMRRALETLAASGQKNETFLRPGARLAVIFLSDEDDCSGPPPATVPSNTSTWCRDQRTASPSELTPVQDYVDFLRGSVGGEVRDVVVGAVVGVTCTGGICTNTRCPDAYTDPPANRFLELLSAFDPAKTTLASICDGDFDAALDQFANAVMSQTMPLVGAVADPAMLVVSVRKPAETVACSVAAVGTAGAATADAVYSPPASGKDATLTFQNDCALAPGDQVEIHLICAG